MDKIEKVTIIGSGPAGYTAAIYAARAGLSPLMISGLEQGGQLMITTDVENYPGFENPIQGPWLMDQMKNQAQAFGTRIKNDFVKEITFEKRPFELITEKESINSHSVIIATGAQAKWLNVKGEKEFMGYGVSACATCDGFFFKGKEVAVIGGGNTAAEESLFLSNLCEKVYLIHRRNKLRAENILQDKVFKKKNIEIIWDSQVETIIGDLENKKLTSVRLINNQNQKSELKIDGLFVAIGHSPATNIFKHKIQMDSDGYIFTQPDSTKTNVEGVFAAGDVTDRIYRQAVTAAGMGCMAALEAEKFLSH